MSYTPQRTWTIAPGSVELPNNNGHFIYAKVPIDDEVSTATVIADESHIDPLRDAGYIIYKLGYIHPLANGKREVSMLWGNVKPSKTYTISEPLTGDIDGTNRTFYTSQNYEAGSVAVFVNGLKESDFTATGGNEIVLGYAPLNVGFTDKVEVLYTVKN